MEFQFHLTSLWQDFRGSQEKFRTMRLKTLQIHFSFVTVRTPRKQVYFDRLHILQLYALKFSFSIFKNKSKILTTYPALHTFFSQSNARIGMYCPLITLEIDCDITKAHCLF